VNKKAVLNVLFSSPVSIPILLYAPSSVFKYARKREYCLLPGPSQDSLL
jgi:hypothetical protein